MKQKIVRFNCPDCNEHVLIMAAGLAENGKMYLVGKCKCGSNVMVDIETLIVNLMTEVKTSGN